MNWWLSFRYTEKGWWCCWFVLVSEAEWEKIVVVTLSYNWSLMGFVGFVLNLSSEKRRRKQTWCWCDLVELVGLWIVCCGELQWGFEVDLMVWEGKKMMKVVVLLPLKLQRNEVARDWVEMVGAATVVIMKALRVEWMREMDVCCRRWVLVVLWDREPEMLGMGLELCLKCSCCAEKNSIEYQVELSWEE